MTETLNRFPEADLQTPPKTFLEAEAAVEAAYAAEQVAGEQFDLAYGRYDETQKVPIDTALDRYDRAIEVGITNGESVPTVADFFADSQEIPLELASPLEELQKTYVARKNAREACDTFLPEKRASVAERLHDIEDRLDTAAIVPLLERGESDTIFAAQLSRVLAARELVDQGADFDYDQLMTIDRIVGEFANESQSRGLLLAESQPIVGEAPDIELLTPEAQDKVFERLTAAYHINRQYGRITKPVREKLAMHTDAVVGAIHKLPPAEIEVTVDSIFSPRPLVKYTPAMKSMFVRQLAERLKELPTELFEDDTNSPAYKNYVEKITQINGRQAAEKIQIDDKIESLPVTITPQEIRDFLATSFPSVAVNDVDVIEFSEIDQSEDETVRTRGLNVYNVTTGRATIIIDPSGVREEHEYYQKLVEGMPLMDADEITRDKLLDFLAHETGHSLHGTLPFGALSRYHKAIQNDPTNITKYVKRAHSSDHPNRYKEDFADTVTLFTRQPHVLNIISNTRFKAMQEIYETFMPDYNTTLRPRQLRKIASIDMLIENGTITREEIVKAYLEHDHTDSPEESKASKV